MALSVAPCLMVLCLRGIPSGAAVPQVASAAAVRRSAYNLRKPFSGAARRVF